MRRAGAELDQEPVGCNRRLMPLVGRQIQPLTWLVLESTTARQSLSTWRRAGAVPGANTPQKAPAVIRVIEVDGGNGRDLTIAVFATDSGEFRVESDLLADLRKHCRFVPFRPRMD